MRYDPSNKTSMLIGGELVAAERGEWLEATDPATDETIGYVPSADSRDVARAVSAAQAAQPGWAALTAAERAHYIGRFIAAIEQRGGELVETEVRDAGIVVAAMQTDVAKTKAGLSYYAAAGRVVRGETPTGISPHLHMTLREPFGVVGRIVPFNHPFMFMAARAGAPLMMGNTLITKAPETSSLSAHVLAEICRDVFPPGVVNIITGTGAIAGDALVRHSAVKRIAFTGSTRTGLAIQAAAASVGVKHISLELGGKNPMVVFADADVDAVADAAVRAMNFGWQGQSCGSLSRIYAHQSLRRRLVAALADRISALRIGSPLDPQSQAGPVNSDAQYRRIMRLIASAIDDGARAVTGGKRVPGKAKGHWIAPTLFDQVEHGMPIAREEVFGPVLSVLEWSDLDDVLNKANDSGFGLTASIWTNNLGDAMRASRAIRAGAIWVNGAGAHYYGLPFGGFKDSGLGREECLEELESYTEVKSITFTN